MNAIGIIFSNIHDNHLPEFTKERTFGAVPFGGRYRLIDFVLSNMTNSGITTVGVVARNNYHSLTSHLGSGKEWDLSRKFGGLTIYPPYSTASGRSLYTGRLEALKNVYNYIERAREDYVVLSDCDVVCNMDYAEVLRFHKENNADITAVYHKVDISEFSGEKLVTYKITDGNCVKTHVGGHPSGVQNLSMSMWLLKKELLLKIIDEALATGLQSFERDILAVNAADLKIVGYEFTGYARQIVSTPDFFRANLELLDRKVRDEICQKDRPIYTKVYDAAPARYMNGASVKNSLIANGAVIMGTVENCVLGREVYIAKNTVVKNSVIMHGAIINENCVINNCILDKKTVVRPGQTLSGTENYPFVAVKGSII